MLVVPTVSTSEETSISIRRAYRGDYQVGSLVDSAHLLKLVGPVPCIVLHDAKRVDPNVANAQPPG